MRRAMGVAVLITLLAVPGTAAPAHAWDSFGHMMVAYVAYQELKPDVKQRADALLKLNPKYDEWVGWLPAQTSTADQAMMIFMIAATWPDQIKHDPTYTSDGSHGGNRPDGSPDPSANRGYDDKLLHKYWHFVDTPFSKDGTPLPAIPSPNALDRITLFRGVLNSAAADPLKSYDLAWLLHLVGDVHQPLHCVTRVSATLKDGDDGGNAVRVSCPGCPSSLHAFWDDAAGTAQSEQAAIPSAIAAAKKLPAADPALAGKSDETIWVQESFDAAKTSAYARRITIVNAPIALSGRYRRAAVRLARARIALAGARLANLLNEDLK